MNSASIDQLNNIFSFQGEGNYLRFKAGKGSIPIVEIQNEQASAVISLQGAHVLSWIPTGQEDVIWLSKDAKFAPGKSVRGGIPICWPWFGAHESNSSYPAHGFARTVLWQVTNTKQLSGGETQITFKLECHELDDEYRKMWPHDSMAEYRLTIGRVLTIELTTNNYSDDPITVGQALHTYFNVDNVSRTSVLGLEGKEYLDKTDGFKRKKQTGPVTINAEVDRIYLKTADDVIIDDRKRKIVIKKQGSESTIVWNPWIAVAEKMGDLGKDGYLKMLCVESANAAEDTVSIPDGDSFTLRVTYEVGAA